MWCPKCGEVHGPAAERCPVCGGRLQKDAALPELEPEFVMYLVDRQELEKAEQLLAQFQIPRRWEQDASEDGAGGAELYVDRRFTHRARRLLRPIHHSEGEEMDEQALTEAMERYTAAYGSADADDWEDWMAWDDESAPEGYRTALFFYIAFGAVLVLAALMGWFLM